MQKLYSPACQLLHWLTVALMFASLQVGDFAKNVHYYGQWVVYFLIALDLAGVTYHAVVERDGLLGRMLPRQSLDSPIDSEG